MESVHQHCRNKSGMYCVVVWGESEKCFTMFSRPLHSLIFGQIHVVVRTRTAKKCTKMNNARAGRAEVFFFFLLIRAIVL